MRIEEGAISRGPEAMHLIIFQFFDDTNSTLETYSFIYSQEKLQLIEHL